LDKDERYIPPTTYTVTNYDTTWWDDPYWGYYRPYPYHYWGYWAPAVQVTQTPGYWETYKTYRVESALYRTEDGKLVWTALSETYDPAGKYDLARSLTDRIIKQMRKNGLLG
jgi:hypothetical protein